MNEIIYRRKLVQTRRTVEVELYPVYKSGSTRGRKSKKSSKAQKNLNAKNSLKSLVRVVNNNFTENDFFVTPTFDDGHLPRDATEAKRVVKNYLARLKRSAEKQGKPFKWVQIVECGTVNGRLHVHLIMSGADAAAIMKQWKCGIIEISPLRASESGFTALAKYHGKTRGKRRNNLTLGNCKTWTCSRNIEKPKVTYSDAAISKKALYRLIVSHDESAYKRLLTKALREKCDLIESDSGDIADYEDWQFLERSYQINDISGYYLYLTFNRRE